MGRPSIVAGENLSARAAVIAHSSKDAPPDSTTVGSNVLPSTRTVSKRTTRASRVSPSGNAARTNVTRTGGLTTRCAGFSGGAPDADADAGVLPLALAFGVAAKPPAAVVVKNAAVHTHTSRAADRIRRCDAPLRPRGAVGRSRHIERQREKACTAAVCPPSIRIEQHAARLADLGAS